MNIQTLVVAFILFCVHSAAASERPSYTHVCIQNPNGSKTYARHQVTQPNNNPTCNKPIATNHKTRTKKKKKEKIIVRHGCRINSSSSIGSMSESSEDDEPQPIDQDHEQSGLKNNQSQRILFFHRLCTALILAQDFFSTEEQKVLIETFSTSKHSTCNIVNDPIKSK